MSNQKHTAVDGSDLEFHSYRNLLLLLLVYIFVTPFLSKTPAFALHANLSLSIALFFSIYPIRRKRKLKPVAITVLLPTLAIYWLGIWDVLTYAEAGSFFLIALYLGLLIYGYGLSLRYVKTVTAEVIYLALCLYLIIGLFFGAVHGLLYQLDPGAYSGGMLETSQGNRLGLFTYFSIVTLTTLGYGDIIPQTPGASSLCQLEAIVGQFFMAVLLAWLMGTFINSRSGSE